jgi:hypothetical protein
MTAALTPGVLSAREPHGFSQGTLTLAPSPVQQAVDDAFAPIEKWAVANVVKGLLYLLLILLGTGLIVKGSYGLARSSSNA